MEECLGSANNLVEENKYYKPIWGYPMKLENIGSRAKERPNIKNICFSLDEDVLPKRWDSIPIANCCRITKGHEISEVNQIHIGKWGHQQQNNN